MGDQISFRKASLKDLRKIRTYLDKYLRKDWFDTTVRLADFLRRENCWLAELGKEIVGFCVVEKNNVMIRLLVIPKMRGREIGKSLVEFSQPQIIRSKTDQSTGDPSLFYEKLGFKKIGTKVGRKKNIQLMIKQSKTNDENKTM